MHSQLAMFEHLGAEVGEVKLSPMADYAACGWVIISAEAYAIHEPWLKARFNDYGELFRDRIAQAIARIARALPDGGSGHADAH